jgi:hypothetical protein
MKYEIKQTLAISSKQQFTLLISKSSTSFASFAHVNVDESRTNRSSYFFFPKSGMYKNHEMSQVRGW